MCVWQGPMLDVANCNQPRIHEYMCVVSHGTHKTCIHYTQACMYIVPNACRTVWITWCVLPHAYASVCTMPYCSGSTLGHTYSHELQILSVNHAVQCLCSSRVYLVSSQGCVAWWACFSINMYWCAHTLYRVYGKRVTGQAWNIQPLRSHFSCNRKYGRKQCNMGSFLYCLVS